MLRYRDILRSFEYDMQTNSEQISKVMPEITGSTKVVALVGSGISYSLSPSIHNYSAALLKRDCVCIPIDVGPLSVKPVLDVLWSMGAEGASITTPHKEAVAREVAGGCASVNSIYRGEGHWVGQSTDAEGLARALQRVGVELAEFKHVVILGSGGVTLAILEYLKNSSSLKDITVIRRNSERDAALKNALLPNEKIIKFLPFEPDSLKSMLFNKSDDTLLIQATNAPYHGDDLSAFCPGLDDFSGVVVDLIYSTPSALLTRAKELGLISQDGLPMLIEQALLSQRMWWGQSAEYQSIFEMLKNRIK